MGGKILITGSSGFIATNLIDRLVELNYTVKGIDISPPRNESHNKFYENVDLKDRQSLMQVFLSFKPQCIIHLAARTDLDGKAPVDYLDNTLAVQNLCDVSIEYGVLDKIIFTSSMLVCRAGYIPKDVNDYCPTTQYGRSKVEGELIVRALEDKLPQFDIIRPTSIWGPWFEAPYRSFFDLVLRGKYVRIGKKSCAKTYGYVGNAVNQIISLLEYDAVNKNKVYYIGDESPINADDWAVDITKKAGLPPPKKLPFIIFQLAAVFGDCISLLGVTFPLTSFRLKNMTTENIFKDLPVCEINKYEVVSIDEATNTTINWIKLNK